MSRVTKLESKILILTGMKAIYSMYMAKKIAVIDGQGGGIGEQIIRKIRKVLPEDVSIIALGTNAIAAANMMKAGANQGASGENAVMVNVSRLGESDYIIGTVARLAANSMLGELTPKMAQAIADSPAQKILLPINTENIHVVGVTPEPLPHLIDKLIEQIK